MAFRAGGGEDRRQPNLDFDRYYRTKRRLDEFDEFEDSYAGRDSLPPEAKRSRSTPFGYNGEVGFLAEPGPSPGPESTFAADFVRYTPPPPAGGREPAKRQWPPSRNHSPDPDSGSEDVGQSFLVRRGDEFAGSIPPVLDNEMERTASGLAIRSDIVGRCASTELLEDDEAANRVREHMNNFKRRNPDSKHERILRSIINPRSMNAEYPLDDDSLQSIFSAANEIFYNGRLSQRVRWDWSHESSSQYDSRVIGTTALRRASKRGFETLIVLSSPILRDQKYSRRLLISTFLHELIHSYLFICCGFRAGHCGGHTPGFRSIAQLIDDWAGPDSQLYLCKMEADLERFRLEGGRCSPSDCSGRANHPVIYPCSGFEQQNITHAHSHSHPHPHAHAHSHATAAPVHTHDRGLDHPDHHHDHHSSDPRWASHRAVRPLRPGPGHGEDFGPTYIRLR